MKKFVLLPIFFIFYTLLNAHGNGYGFMGHHMFWPGGWSWVLILIAIVAFIIIGKRWHKDDKLEETPLSILEKRYANGEISDDEFERMKAKLQ